MFKRWRYYLIGFSFKTTITNGTASVVYKTDSKKTCKSIQRAVLELKKEIGTDAKIYVLSVCRIDKDTYDCINAVHNSNKIQETENCEINLDKLLLL